MKARSYLFVSVASVVVLAGQAGAQTVATQATATPATVAQTEGSSGQPEAQTSSSINDIIVTARRRQESAQRVPVSVAAFSAEKLAERSVTQIDQLTYSTPGLTYGRAGGSNNPQIVIRGQSRANIGDAPQPVLSYFNDVPVPTDGSILPTYDLSSVQVLKGPQGTLFGRNSTTGAVLIYPTAPTYEFEGYIQAGYGNYNRREGEGAINVPIITDKVALRVAGQYIKRDGYTKNLGTGGDFDNQDDKSFRASLRVDPTDNLSSTTVYDFTKWNRVGDGPILHSIYPDASNTLRSALFRGFYDCNTSVNCDIDLQLQRQQAAGVRKTYSDITPVLDIKTTGIMNTSTLDVGDFTLKNIIGRRTAYVRGYVNTDGSSLPLIVANTIFKQTQFSEEFQVQGNLFDNKLQTIAGAFYLKAKPNGTGSSLALANFYVSPFAPPAVIQSYRTITSKALFGAATYNFGGGFKLNLGIRYTKDRTSACALGYPATNPLAFDNVLFSPAECNSGATKTINGVAVTRIGDQVSKSSDAVTYNVGVDYQATRDLFFYATVRKGYRSGGVNTPLFSTIAPKSLAPFQTYNPETVNDVEIGAKTDFHFGEATARFNVSIYRGIYKNSQRGVSGLNRFDGDGISTNDPSAGTIVVNAGKSRVQGVDFEAILSPTKALSFTVFGSYVDAVYKNLGLDFTFFNQVPPPFPSTTQDTAFPYSPKFTLGGNIRYAYELGGNSRIVGNIDGYHSSRVFYSPFKTDFDLSQKGYELFNARLDLENIAQTNISLGFYMRNIFNRAVVSAGAQTARSAGFTSVIYNEPRMYGVQGKFRF